MTVPAIELQGLRHSYDGTRLALDDVSFSLAVGQFSALLGPNGAGKTTLFSLLTRLITPREGRVLLFGSDLRQHAASALAQTGIVFQQPTLDLDLTVLQNLHYHGALHGLSPKQVTQSAQEELERFDLWSRRDDKVRSLNGGHRRRVEIARALLHKPALLLLDEATAGLDLETRTQLYRYVRSLSTERRMAILWTTHVVEELDPEDDAILLAQGKIVGRGSLRELAAQRDLSSPADVVLNLSGDRS